jgi:SAM-dependent methyltransferase
VARIDDPAYLRSAQYRTGENLEARIRFHERFGTHPLRWPRWVFERLRLPASCRILEVGCGTGNLWEENRERIPPGWKVLLSDLSPGMAAQAVLDARELPFPNGSFEAVIANHMLYHVPNRPRALAEIRRVLAPGGRFYAATGGRDQFRELLDLVYRFDPSLVLWEGRDDSSFLLENGAAQLAPWFPEVLLHRYEDSLVVTEAAPLVAYVASKVSLPPGFLPFVEAELKRLGGALRIRKDYGLFECPNPGSPSVMGVAGRTPPRNPNGDDPCNIS